jgi:cell wall-associated NlpC family hydrolase
MIATGDRIASIADEWIATPFIFGACRKGAGVDCARFVVAVMKEAGLIPPGYQPPKAYADWIYGKKVDKETFIREIVRYCDRVEYDQRQTGDVVSFMFNGIESHIGILTADGCIIHAAQDREVIKTRLKNMRNIRAVYRIRE